MSKIVFFLFIVLLQPITITQALTVDVFTTIPLGLKQTVVLYPLPKATKVNIYKVDKLKQLQDGLNQLVKSSVPAGDNKAFKKITMQWINLHKNAYTKVAAVAQEIYQDNVTDIPAIIFNHKYCVLGTNDINQAYQIYLNTVGHNHV